MSVVDEVVVAPCKESYSDSYLKGKEQGLGKFRWFEALVEWRRAKAWCQLPNHLSSLVVCP